MAHDELAEIDGHKPKVLLADGEERQVQSMSSNSTYKVKRTWDHYYCVCPAWRNQAGAPTNARSCKHLVELLGADYEAARLKWKNPDGPPLRVGPASKKKASKAKPASSKGKPASKAKGKRKADSDEEDESEDEKPKKKAKKPASKKRKVESDEDDESQSEDEKPKKKKKSASKKRKLESDEDESESEEEKPKKKKAASKRRKAESDEDESEDEKPKKKKKPVSKKRGSTSEEDDSEDEKPKKKAKKPVSKKRKVESDEESDSEDAKPKKKRAKKSKKSSDSSDSEEETKSPKKSPSKAKPKSKRVKSEDDDDDDGENGIGPGGAPALLLANKWDIETGPDPTGWWISEKLDGVRTFYNGKGMVSRLGNPFTPPQWFLDKLPKDVTLDGELFGGRGNFQDTVSIVKTMNSPHWKEITFHIFDIPSENTAFEDRIGSLKKLFGPGGKYECPEVILVEQEKAKNRKHVLDKLKDIETLGGEGLMLRRPKSKYEGKRSSTLLKVKTFYDAEAEVTGYTDGKGKHVGLVGALKCKMASGKNFNVGTGLSDKQRKDPPKIGSIIVYRFQELTRDGVPRFPSYIGEAIDKKKAKDAVLPAHRKTSGKDDD